MVKSAPFIFVLLSILIVNVHARDFKCIDEFGNVSYSNDGCPNFSSPPKAYGKSAFKCKKKNGTTEFSDEPCDGLSLEEVEIIEYNNTQGLSYSERVRHHNYDARIQSNKEKYRTNNYYSENGSTSTTNQQKCQHHTNAANMLNTQMRKGYRAEQYNYFQKQLRYQKEKIRKFCQ